VVSYVTSFVVLAFFHDVLGKGVLYFSLIYKVTSLVSSKRAHFLASPSNSAFVFVNNANQSAGGEASRCGQLRYVFCVFIPLLLYVLHDFNIIFH